MANGQTCIQYGDVRLYRCQTKRVEQRPVMDSAKVNLKCWRFVVHVTGFLHGFSEACKWAEIITDDTAPTSASEAHKQVRWRLAPRQTFRMAVGCTAPDVTSGEVLLYAEPMAGVVTPADLADTGLTNYDVNDGPLCTMFDVIHVSGDNIYRVDATFEIQILPCADDGTSTNVTGVLAHRWSSVDRLDHNLRATRSYHGLLELATSNFSPHWFRYLVVPPLQPGMRRDRLEFTATKDGKKLQYTIVDTEVAFSAPPPARKWSVEHTESVLNRDGLKVTSQISVTLEGASDVDKGQLIILGLYIVSAKLQGSKPGEVPVPDEPIFFNDISITDLTGDVNIIRIHASCWRMADSTLGLAIRVDGFNKIITAADLPAFAANYDFLRSAGGYDDDVPEYEGPIPLAGIFRAYLQHPCAGLYGINNANQIGDDNLDAGDLTRTAFTGRIVPSLEEDAVPWFSESHQAHMYTTFQMESIYKTRRMRAAMPIASAPYSGSGVDTSNATSVITLSRPQGRRIVRIHAERAGDWPELPDPDGMEDGNATVAGSLPAIGQLVLSTKLLGGTQTKCPFGCNLFRASAEFELALSRAPTATELLKFGSNVWSSDGEVVSTATLTNSAYS